MPRDGHPGVCTRWIGARASRQDLPTPVCTLTARCTGTSRSSVRISFACFPLPLPLQSLLHLPMNQRTSEPVNLPFPFLSHCALPPRSSVSDVRNAQALVPFTASLGSFPLLLPSNPSSSHKFIQGLASVLMPAWPATVPSRVSITFFFGERGTGMLSTLSPQAKHYRAWRTHYSPRDLARMRRLLRGDL